MTSRALRWLWPGLHVKRWLALFVLAVVGAAVAGVRLVQAWGHPHHGAGNDIILLLAGIAVGIVCMRQLVNSIVSALIPDGKGDIAAAYWRTRALVRGPKVVALGGGTGLPVLLRGLKQYTSNITAIVAVTDDGGSSGILRGQLGVPPPGDIRNCLLALAETEPLLEQLFQYRFKAGEGLLGHAFGNLFLAAMVTVTGDLRAAIRASSRVLAVRGQVLPATDDSVTLVAELRDGVIVRGESQIPLANAAIRRVMLEPAEAQPTDEALRAIAEADIIVLSPGSLFTSLMPNLLIRGIPEAISASKAQTFYIQNIMTQPGETDGMSAEEHLKAIRDLTGHRVVDCIVLNSEPLPRPVLERYREQHAEVVTYDAAHIADHGVDMLVAPLLSQGNFARHDGDRLAQAVLERWANRRPEPGRIVDYLLLRELLRGDRP